MPRVTRDELTEHLRYISRKLGYPKDNKVLSLQTYDAGDGRKFCLVERDTVTTGEHEISGWHKAADMLLYLKGVAAGIDGLH